MGAEAARLQYFPETLRPLPHREKSPFVPELAVEVARIRRQGKNRENIYLLPETGFDVQGQIDLLLSNTASGIPLENSFAQIEQDVQAFKIEYLTEGALFPIILNREIMNGSERIQSPLYGGELWLDVTSEREREGVVKQTVGRMEQFLVAACPGSMAIFTSPPGWSGYENRVYPDTQTYGIEVREDRSIRGFTVKSSLTVEQNEALLHKIGAQETFKATVSRKDQIKRIIQTPVFLTPEQNKGGVKWLIDTVEEIRGARVAFVDTKGVARTFGEACAQLQNPEALWTLDATTQELVDTFKDQVTYELSCGETDRRNLEIGLGRIILELAQKIRGNKACDSQRRNSEEIRASIPFNAEYVLRDVQSIPGCAGGGNTRETRSGLSSLREKRIFCCTCPHCGQQVDAIIEGETITCPKCSAQAPWSDEGIAQAA